jgi:hypothetical protein
MITQQEGYILSLLMLLLYFDAPILSQKVLGQWLIVLQQISPSTSMKIR